MITEIILGILCIVAAAATAILFRIKPGVPGSSENTVTAQTPSPWFSSLPLLGSQALFASIALFIGWTVSVVTLKNQAAEDAAKQVRTYERDAKANYLAMEKVHADMDEKIKTVLTEVGKLRDTMQVEGENATEKMKTVAKKVGAQGDEISVQLEKREKNAKEIEDRISKIHDKLDKNVLLATIAKLQKQLQDDQRKLQDVEAKLLKELEAERADARLQIKRIQDGNLSFKQIVIFQGTAKTVITPGSFHMSSGERGSAILLETNPEHALVRVGTDKQNGVAFGNVGGRPFGHFYKDGKTSPLTALPFDK